MEEHLTATFLQHNITLSLLRSNILLSSLFSKSLKLHSSLNVRNHVSDPNKTTGTIIILNILMFMVFESSLESRDFELHDRKNFPNLNSS
jgi:hypothetical protein